ncbi:MAG: HGGxSTG domain-containing protein [Devosia sp.]
MPRKIRRYLEGLKAHERLVNVVSRARGVSGERRIPIDWDFACGARTRAGTSCKLKAIYASGRCKLHGGCSTGPKTEAGKDRIREGQRRRREKDRAQM